MYICYDYKHCQSADVAELVDAPDLGSGVFGREGSSPFIRIAFGFLRVLTFTVTPVNPEAKTCSKLAQK